MSMVLVDVGNTSIKWCQHQSVAQTRIADVHRSAPEPQLLLAGLCAAEVAPETPVWIASVAGTAFDEQLRQGLVQAGFRSVTFVTSVAQEHGLTNAYAVPQSMGVDRWLAMVAARHARQAASLVVDVGTALTMDLIDAEGRHVGGYIIPGVQLMEASLTRDTQRVRFDEAARVDISPGASTAECVSGGIWVALVGAVKWVADHHPGFGIIMAGGDGQKLLELGLAGEWRPFLVLEGLAIHAITASEG